MGTLHSWVMLLLIVLPFAVIGYAAGCLNMRRNYLELLRRVRRENRRLVRLLSQDGRRSA